MKVIKPVILTDSMLVSPAVPENDDPVWAAGTSYNQGQRVISTATHRIYESVPTSGNVGHDPATRTDDSNWIDIGPTNRWAMFDQAVGTATEGPTPLAVTLAPGAAGALAVLDTDAEQVQVQVMVGGTKLYDRTQSTNISGGVITDWYAYFTAAIGKVMTLTFDDLPLYANAQITTTLTAADPQGTVSVGTLMVGQPVDLGLTEADATISNLDFSEKTTDQFGVTTVVERAWSKQMQVKAIIDSTAVDGVQRLIASLRAKPALYIGEDGFDSLAIYGFYKDFSIDLALETYSYVSLTVEGLI